MILYLIRHGQSEGNVAQTFHGQTDYPLTDLGRQQAREVAEKLRDVKFTRCCASDLQRAWNTALPCLEGRDIVPEPCPGLREQFVGEMEGMSRAEVEARWPGMAEAYIKDWHHTTPPGGESFPQMLERVGKTIDRIIADGRDTLVAAHYGSLSMIFIHLGLIRPELVMTKELVFQQGVYSAIEISPDGRATLLCFNK